jgi:hypothetical protein
MPDWVTCSSCGLKHSARADGVCPRCKNPVDGSADAPAADGPPDVYDGTPPAAYAPGARASYAPAPSAGSSNTTKILLFVAAGGILLLLFGGIALRALLGSNPLTRLALSGQTDGSPVTSAEGRAFRYRLSSTGKDWYFRKPALAKKDNALADIWLIQPSVDAHVLVIAERIGAGQSIDMDRFAQVVIDNAQKKSETFTLVEQRPISNARGFGRLVHTKARINKIDLEFYYGLYAREPEIYQVVASAHATKFAKMAPELLEWVSSFETTAAP